MPERVITRCEIDGYQFCYCPDSKKFVTKCGDKFSAKTSNSIRAWLEYCDFVNGYMLQKIRCGDFQKQNTECYVDGFAFFCDGSGEKYLLRHTNGTIFEFTDPACGWNKYLNYIKGHMLKKISYSLRNRVKAIMHEALESKGEKI